jgi:hypothetical protein
MGFSGLAQPTGFLRRLIITGREGWVIADAHDVLSLKEERRLTVNDAIKDGIVDSSF